MSAVSAPSWPGSRVVLGWWRELAGRHPQQLRISRFLLHRIEALVRVRRSSALDRWQRALLHLAQARLPCHGELLSSFTDLHMDLPFLGQLVRELTETGLIHRNGSGLWQMSPAGRDALATGTLSVAAEERRLFVFVDHSPLGLAPHYLPLALGPARLAGATSPEAAGCSFDVASLEECLQQTPEWKARYRFPTEVEAVVAPRPHESAATNRRSVILDTVEARTLVVIHSAPASAAPLMLGFAVNPEGWTLQPEPVMALAAGCEDALPELTTEPTSEMWRHAWQAWTHPRGLPPVEVEACRLERVDHRLIVHAPPRLVERLRAARSDAVKQEAWLLAGDGRTRTAAQIELRPL
jgi:hypothetical protein